MFDVPKVIYDKNYECRNIIRYRVVNEDGKEHTITEYLCCKDGIIYLEIDRDDKEEKKIELGRLKRENKSYTTIQVATRGSYAPPKLDSATAGGANRGSILGFGSTL